MRERIKKYEGWQLNDAYLSEDGVIKDEVDRNQQRIKQHFEKEHSEM